MSSLFKLIILPLSILGRHFHYRRMIHGILTRIVLTFFGFYLFTAYVIFDYPPPWKVINPEHPRFDPMVFQWPDYTSRKELGHALRTMFPPGTDKADVDKILVEVGGGKGVLVKNKPPNIGDPTDQLGIYSYNQVPRRFLAKLALIPMSDHIPSHRISIIFDASLKLKRIIVVTSM